MAFSKGTRFEIFKRDGFQCQYCGSTPPLVTLEADHIDPQANGGSDEIDNGITSCMDCNRGKGAKLLSVVPMPFSEKMKLQEERAAQIEAYTEMQLSLRRKREEVVSLIGRYWYNKLQQKQNEFEFGEERARSIRMFLDRLVLPDILDSIDVAHNKFHWSSTDSDYKMWRYFCGVCWRKIRQANGEEPANG